MQLEQAEKEYEIDLKALFFELLEHWKVLLLSTVMVAAIALVISKFILVPQYQSTSALYVLSNTITSLADVQIGTNLTNDYIVVVQGRPVLEQVIENLGLSESYGQLRGKVSLNNPTSSRILEITVTDPDPVRAKQITDEIARVASDYISVKMVQAAPTTIQNGYADGNPVSPNIKRNTFLGAAVGFFLAAAAVSAAYLLNDTVMTMEDVEQKLGLNFLGSLPDTSQDESEEKRKRQKGPKKKAGTEAFTGKKKKA